VDLPIVGRRLGGRLRTCGVLLVLIGALLQAARPAGAGPCEASFPVDDERASRILAEERPFAPADRDLFYSFTDSDWIGAAPLDFADGPALSEQQTREELRAFLERRFPCEPQRVRDGLAVYGDPAAQQKVPEPTLRAALAALTGTLGEPAIEYLLYRAPVALIHFGVFVFEGQGLPGALAGTYGMADGTQQIVFDRRGRFAPFAAFSALLFHEALHADADDTDAGLPEEALASALEALIYMEMLLTEPALAQLPDELTRFNNNPMALIRLNSGPPGTDRLSLFVPGSDVDIDPLGDGPLTEFYEYYLHYGSTDYQGFRERETAGNWLLRTVLEALAEPGASPPDDADFDAETVAFVDQNQATLSPAELVAVACILKLDLPCDEDRAGAVAWRP
jgi:hypothetical protein